MFDDGTLCLAGDPALLVLGRPSTLAYGRSEGRGPAFHQARLARRLPRLGDLNAWLDDSTIRPADGQQGRDLPMRPVGHHHAAGRERPRAGHREVACLFASLMSRRVPRARQQRCVRAAAWAISHGIRRRSTLPLGRFQPLLLPADSVAARTNAGPARPPPRRALVSRLFNFFETWEWRAQHTNPVRGVERAREEASVGGGGPLRAGGRLAGRGRTARNWCSDGGGDGGELEDLRSMTSWSYPSVSGAR